MAVIRGHAKHTSVLRLTIRMPLHIFVRDMRRRLIPLPLLLLMPMPMPNISLIMLLKSRCLVNSRIVLHNSRRLIYIIRIAL
jgi:hypothetical protein